MIPLALVLASLVLPTIAGAAEEDVPNEDALIAVLQSEGAYMTHLAAFRGLRQVGTEKSIPVLAGFLHDEKASHLARYALEGMAYDAAGQALRESLDGAPETVLTGIITSLGVRRDGEATGALVSLISHSTPDVSLHAKAALGRIATPEAADALMSAHRSAPEDLDVAEALLAAAQNLTDDGNLKAAAPIYRELRNEGNTDFVRIGAFYGLVAAAPDETPERVLEAIQGTDPLYRNLAREIVAETEGKKATEVYATALPTLPAEVQVEMLAGLARRGDTSAREAVVSLIEQAESSTRLAAIDALGELGSEKDVQQLAALMGSEDKAIATTSRNSLIRLRGEKVDPAIVVWMKKAGAETKAALLTILDVRIAAEAVPQSRIYLNDRDEAVRLAALNVFLQQGVASDFAPLLARLQNATGDGERDLASRALAAIAKREREACLPEVLAALTDGSEAVKLSLVTALSDMGGPEALAAATALLEDPSPAVKKKALDVLSDWPTQDAAETLLALAKSEEAAAHDAGLKGYTRLAQSHPEHDPKNAMMATAMELARSKEDKWMVLSAYGTVHTGPALDALEAQLDDPEVQKEAAMALLKVNEAVTKHGEAAHPRVRKSLELLKSKVAVEYVQKRADELLAALK